MRISTPVRSRARKDKVISQCVTRTMAGCRGGDVSGICEIVLVEDVPHTGNFSTRYLWPILKAIAKGRRSRTNSEAVILILLAGIFAVPPGSKRPCSAGLL